MTDRELMQQALDAMRDAAFDEEGYIMNADLAEAHDALRNRLAHCDRCGKRLGGEGDIHTCTPDPIGDAQDKLIAEMAAQPAPVQKPVATMRMLHTYGDTTPPAAAQPEQEPVLDDADMLLIRRSHVKRAITCLNTAENADLRLVLRDLFALLKTPPAPVQPAYGQKPDAFALRTKKHGLEFNSGYGMVKTLEQAQEMQRRHMGNLEIVELRATPPAAAQQEPVALREALAEALGCVYVCNRTWSAWGIGTMSQDDFYPAAESDDVLDSLVEAVAKARPVKDEWELRGELARLKCWHRLTEDEVNDLLRFAANTPPAAQRTWVGLTPEEIDKTHETQVWDARRSFARAIEAKLKEKNT